MCYSIQGHIKCKVYHLVWINWDLQSRKKVTLEIGNLHNQSNIYSEHAFKVGTTNNHAFKTWVLTTRSYGLSINMYQMYLIVHIVNANVKVYVAINIIEA